MANLQDLISLSKADGGKFFVLDETGEVRLVIMPVEEYQRLLLGKLKRQIEDVERINREIIKAQLKEETGGTKEPPLPKPPVRPANRFEEVIDPSFDFEGPKTDAFDL